MPSPPRLFDRTALAQRRARAALLAAASPGNAPDFLLQRVADDFSERLHVIRRTFVDVIDLGCRTGRLGRTLAAAHKLAHVTSADECADYLALAGEPRVRVDLERLPFAPASACF